MAKLLILSKRNPRIKKWEHFKLKYRKLVLQASVLLNVGTSTYLAYEHGLLTNIIEHVAPIMESVKHILPL